MGTLLGIALALVSGHNGTNGFNPADLILIPQAAGKYDVYPLDALMDWFIEDPDEREDVVRYFIRCAAGPDKVATLGPFEWRGEYGLAEPLPQPEAIAGVPKRGIRILGQRVDGLTDVDKWISACFIAHANTRLSHEFIWLRGNPSSSVARGIFKPKPAEQWTAGYPEGVFFGDLFDRPAHAGENLKSFTVSMNIPEGGVPQGWRPPNAVLGRTLDYEKETWVTTQEGQRVRVSARLGTYEGNRASLRVEPGTVDAEYPEAAVCLKEDDQLAPCSGAQSPAARILRPLFVNLPWLANLEAASKTPDTGARFPVFDTGSSAIREDQSVDCRAGTCVGTYFDFEAGGTPHHPNPRAEGKKLVGLSKGQSLEPALRLPAAQSAGAASHQIEAKQDFTAIVRYACRQKACQARAMVRDRKSGAWTPVGETWPSTLIKKAEYGWLQVYPFYVTGKEPRELRIRIDGVLGDGASEAAPVLDAVGFVPGAPRCEGAFDPPRKRGAPFMGVCRYR